MKKCGLIFFSIVCGAVLMCAAPVPAHAAPRASYDRLERLFLEGKYEAVVTESDGLVKSGSARKDDIYYLRGLSQLKLNQFEAARASFNHIGSNFSKSKRNFDARLGVGDSYMLEGDLNSAVGIYNGMQSDYEKEKNLPVVYSRLASCYSGLGLKDKAANYLAMAKRASPNSFEAKGQGNVVAHVVRKSPASKSAAAPTARADDENDVVMASGKGISVQIGCFKNPTNAQRLARQLSAQGYESRVEMPVGQQDRLYRVKIGNASSRGETEVLEMRLKRAGFKTKICDNDLCE